MAASQRMKVATEKYSKNIVKRGKVPVTNVIYCNFHFLIMILLLEVFYIHFLERRN